MRTIVLTGITGQLSYYLSKLFLEKGYKVIGTMRRTSSPTTWRLDELPKHLRDKLIIREADITDYGSIVSVIKEFNPDWFINTSAQSFVQNSFKAPISTFEITALGAINCLDAVRQYAPNCKFMTCSSSEMFGNRAISDKERSDVKEVFRVHLDENSGFMPRSPYGIAKLAAHHMVDNYRKAFGMWAIAPIMFNYESSVRGIEFITRKITHGVANILAGKQEYIELGNLDSYRDFTHCEDIADAIHLMMEMEKPVDYVLGSGTTHSIRKILDTAFGFVGINDWSKYVKINKEHIRPVEVDVLISNPSKIKNELGWKPKFSFKDLVESMVKKDCERLGVTL